MVLKPVNNQVQVIIHSILLTSRPRILGLVLKPVNNQVQVIIHSILLTPCPNTRIFFTCVFPSPKCMYFDAKMG